MIYGLTKLILDLGSRLINVKGIGRINNCSLVSTLVTISVYGEAIDIIKSISASS